MLIVIKSVDLFLPNLKQLSLFMPYLMHLTIQIFFMNEYMVYYLVI